MPYPASMCMQTYNREEIEKSFPEGIIYTIYSLNLRYLFEIQDEGELTKRIEKIRYKNKIITWLTARYRQEKYKREHHSEIEELKPAPKPVEFKNLYDYIKNAINEGRFVCSLNEEGNFDKLTTSAINKFVEDIISCKEIPDFQSESHHIINYLNKLRKEKIKNIDKILSKLNEFHDKTEDEKNELIKLRRIEIRKAEKFLASDEFAAFAEDPFFKISKSKIREIIIDAEHCGLEDATTAEAEIINNGHEYSIFRGHLKDKWLTALTYKVESKEKNASYFIRLSRLGLLQIRKEEKFETCPRIYEGEITDEIKEDFKESLKSYQSKNKLEETGSLDDKTLDAMGINLTYSQKAAVEAPDLVFEPTPSQIVNAKRKLKSRSLIEILKSLLESQKRYSTEGTEVVSEESDILQVAVGFAALLDFHTTSNFLSIFGTQKITALTTKQAREKYEDAERQKYVLISFKKLQNAAGADVKFSDLSNAEVVSCIVQGTLEDNNGRWTIPSARGKTSIVDLSTWSNELCVFSPERGFIFFNDKITFEVGGKLTRYHEYWKCIVRGVEYTVALRASLQVLESRTTRLLNGIPDILKLFSEADSSKEKDKKKLKENRASAKEKIEDLAEALASILRTLPALRSISIPTNAFRSGHSVRKFEYLYNTCFNFEETIRNIQKNIDELTHFLTFFEQQQLQITLDEEASREIKEERKLNIIALVFTLATIIYVLPSFILDLDNFLENNTFQLQGWYKNFSSIFELSTESVSIAIYLIVFIPILLVISWITLKMIGSYLKEK